jgi:hypothetical protein
VHRRHANHKREEVVDERVHEAKRKHSTHHHSATHATFVKAREKRARARTSTAGERQI